MCCNPSGPQCTFCYIYLRYFREKNCKKQQESSSSKKSFKFVEYFVPLIDFIARRETFCNIYKVWSRQRRKTTLVFQLCTYWYYVFFPFIVNMQKRKKNRIVRYLCISSQGEAVDHRKVFYYLGPEAKFSMLGFYDRTCWKNDKVSCKNLSQVGRWLLIKQEGGCLAL